jgi:fibronectin type 3 domain-containing protein
VAGYIVYRVSANGKTDRLTARLVAETKYTDNTVQAGQTYSYYVTSVDAKGVESKPSDKITATVPSTPPAKQ